MAFSDYFATVICRNFFRRATNGYKFVPIGCTPLLCRRKFFTSILGGVKVDTLVGIIFAFISISLGTIFLVLFGLVVLYDTVNLIRYIRADVCRATVVENNGTEKVLMYATSRTGGRYQDYYKHNVEYVLNGQLCRGEVVTERNVKPGGQMNIHVYTDKNGERTIISEKHKNRLIIFAAILFLTIVVSIICIICTRLN